MSKTIIIAENGAAKTLTVDKLRTAGGGLFVPAEEALVDGITIRANGTYKASDFGLKAFDSVKVAVGSGNTALDGNARVGVIKAVTPVIREGNRPRSMGGTRYIKTRVPGGGACVWLPESAITTTTLTANRNGAYSPGDLYGYSQVTVNIGSGGGGGWGGGDVSWGGGGDIPPWVESGEVDHIKITTPPSFLGPYLDGVLIQTDGIEVTAFDENDNALGVIPFEELVFPVTMTDFSQTQYFDDLYTVETNLDVSPLRGSFRFGTGSVTIVLHRYTASLGGYHDYDIYYGGDYITSIHKQDTPYLQVIMASAEPKTFYRTEYWGIEGYNHGKKGVYTYELTTREATINGKTVYYYGSGSYVVHNDSSIQPLYNPGYEMGSGDYSASSARLINTAWAMVYGISHEIPVSGNCQVVPVQWTRPTDGEVLEDFFTISVDDLRPGGQGDDTPAYEEIPGIQDIVF